MPGRDVLRAVMLDAALFGRQVLDNALMAAAANAVMGLQTPPRQVGQVGLAVSHAQLVWQAKHIKSV